MAFLGFELFMRLLWGCALGLVFVRRTESSEKFVKIASRISWGLGACAALLLYLSGQQNLGAWSFLLLFLVGFQLYASLVAPWSRLLGVFLYAFSPLFFLLNSFENHWFLSLINFLSSGCLLGGFFAGQFLGHWFLNVPGMHIRELKRVMNFLFAGLILKTTEVIGFVIWKANFADVQPTIDPMGRPLGLSLESADFLQRLNPSQSLFALEGDFFMGLGFYGIILVSMRLLWGILAPWALSLMISQTIKTRSTQSATGILYAACVMVLVGEATALYLRSVLGFFM